jgi:hypothetical protein
LRLENGGGSGKVGMIPGGHRIGRRVAASFAGTTVFGFTFQERAVRLKVAPETEATLPNVEVLMSTMPETHIMIQLRQFTGGSKLDHRPV